MHYAFPFLPLEVQTSIKEIIALDSIPESAIDLLIARTAKALENKTTSLQMDVVRIEESMEHRVDAIGGKLADDLRSALGDTNGMLLDIRTLAQSQESAVLALRAEFQSVGERLSEVEAKVAEHDQSRDQSIAERRMLRKDMDESKAHRKRLQTTLDETERQLMTIAARLAAIEALLEVAGAFQQEHDRHEAGD